MQAGKALAYVEMRLLLARFCLEFDIEAADQDFDVREWLNQCTDSYLLAAPPLRLKLSPRA